MNVKSERILGYDISSAGRETSVDLCMEWVDSADFARYFACANPHSLVVARRNREFDAALKEADLVIPDGAGIVVGSRILGGEISDRVTGSDMFHGVNRRLQARGGGSCFFLGATPETLEAIRERMTRTYPAVRVAGTFSPPFRRAFSPAENREMVNRVNRARADVLWVGMTAPKQECWIHRNRANLNVRVVGPVGAVFDFFTDNVPRSHPWFQARGLEWLPRLVKQPRRLWERNFVSSPAFLREVFRQRFREGAAERRRFPGGNRRRSG